MLQWLAVPGILIFLASVGPLRAEEFPWCVEVDAFTKNCAFSSHDECAAIAKNVSSPATGEGRCIANPSYVAPVAAKPAKASAKTTAKPH